MKRQLRPILTAVALLCAPLAWSQSGFPNSTPGMSGGPQQGVSTDSSQSQSASGSGGMMTQNGSDQSQNGSDPSQSGTGDLGQNGGSDDQSGLGGPQATFSHPEKLPPLNLFSDAVSHTGYSLTATGGTSAQYISQPGLASYWDLFSLIGGGISIVQAQPKLMWSLGYLASYNNIASPTYSGYSDLNQSAYGNIIWQLSKRWQFRAKDNYFYSDDPFQPFFTYLGQPAPNNPNPVYYFPQAVVEQNQATVDLTYTLGPRDSVDFNGGESFQRFLRGIESENTGPLDTASLWNSITYSGGAFYQHLFSPKLSAGEGYIFTAMDFGDGQSRAGVQMFQTFVNYKYSSRLTISGWIGPELTGTKDIVPVLCIAGGCYVQVVHGSSFNLGEGGTISWAAGHNNTMGLQFSHSIVNGGGLYGAVKFYQVTATFSRPLTRNWGLGAGFNYANSKSISAYQGAQFYYAPEGTVSLTRRFNNALNFSMYYAFIKQTENYNGVGSAPITLTTNGIGATVTYTWNHSLGR